MNFDAIFRDLASHLIVPIPQTCQKLNAYLERVLETSELEKHFHANLPKLCTWLFGSGSTG